MSINIAALANQIDDAAFNASAIEQFSDSIELSTAQAYEIQAASIDNRLQRGEVLCGAKMGFTSREKMLQMGLDDLIIGRLTDAMQISEGAGIDLSDFVHPRVEPEIAFRLSKPLAKNINFVQALDAVDAIAPALEIIDSRYLDFKFSLADVLADNCSSSAFVIGGWQPRDTDISNLGLALNFDDRAVAVGSTAAILGHPLRALIEAARLADEVGVELKAGDIVLAGAATAALTLKPGCSVHADFQNLGRVGFHTKGNNHE